MHEHDSSARPFSLQINTSARRTLQRNVWLDSYFIIVGLLRRWRTDLARAWGDGKFLLRDRNYGALLNANRTYYLTDLNRPFLSFNGPRRLMRPRKRRATPTLHG